MIRVGLLHFSHEDYTTQLANSLANHANVVLIQPDVLSIDHRDVLDSRIHIFSFEKPRVRDPRNLHSMRKMIQLIRAMQLDVLHVQETRDPWYDLTLCLNEMPPLVTTVHDVYRHPGDRNLAFGSALTRQVSFKRSQAFIVHNHPQKAALIDRVPTARTHTWIVPHGELGSLYRRWSNQLSVERESATLLFFGRIWLYKGLQYLIEAMPLIAAQVPNVKLIVAGRGENLNQYFPKGYDDNRYEILNRFISRQEVVGLFQRSTAVILPYIESSQSGVAAIAYSLGTPVIASAIGGLSEMIHHEQDGLLVPPKDVQALADAIIRLLSDRALQNQLQAAALARCQEDLSWPAIALQTLEVYQRTIESKKTT
jgi:glycosyltransferase involved in cell wall biosynthesis